MGKQYVETTIGGARVLIEDASAAGRPAGMRDTAGGGFSAKRVDDLMARMRPVIAGLAGMGEEALSGLAAARPDEVSMTVGMGYDAEVDAWVLKGDASLTFEVEITWKKDTTAGDGAEV